MTCILSCLGKWVYNFGQNLEFKTLWLSVKWEFIHFILRVLHSFVIIFCRFACATSSFVLIKQ